MPSQSLKQAPETGSQTAAPPNGEEILTQLIQLLHPFCEGKNGKSLQSIIRGHDTLQAELSDLHTAYNTNVRMLAQRQIDWDAERSSLQEAVKAEKARFEQSLSNQKDASTKLENERAHAESLRRQIQDNERQIKGLIDAKKTAEGSATKLRSETDTMQARMKEMGQKNSELKDELQQASQRYEAGIEKLNGVQQSLTTVRSFLVQLQGLDDTKRTAMSVLSTTNRC